MSERASAVKTFEEGSLEVDIQREANARSPFRTVLPPEAPVVSGADSLRAVVDNVEHNITEVRAAIEKNMAEALKLERRLEYLLKLQAVTEDYKNGK